MFCVSLLSTTTNVPAATLKEEVYLSRPWGRGIDQVGRLQPSANDDQYPEGVSGFAIDLAGRIGLIDIWNSRIQIFNEEKLLQRTVSLEELGGRPADLDADVEGNWIFVASNRKPGSNMSKAISLDASGKPRLMVNLNPLGFRLAMYIELGMKDDMFIQDNSGFMTFHMTRQGQVIDKQKDDRFFYLLSKGLYTFASNGRTISVSSMLKKNIAVYPDLGNGLAVLGVTSSGSLYVLYRQDREHGSLVLEGLDPDGTRLFSIPLKDSKPESLLNPYRYPRDTRQVRVAADGSIYAADTPDADQFHLYRFKVIP